jgi:hypothetical protein
MHLVGYLWEAYHDARSLEHTAKTRLSAVPFHHTNSYDPYILK